MRKPHNSTVPERTHWLGGVESMHWVLDVEFKDDLSRYRAGGAKNMTVVRRFAPGLLRASKSKGSIKTPGNQRAGIPSSSSKSCS